jgi:hypothetical protein
LGGSRPGQRQDHFKDEYFAFVEAAFKSADMDNDGTIDAKELRSPAGRALQRLLMK